MSSLALTTPLTSSDTFLARFAGLRKRLPGAQDEREAAAARFGMTGLPGPGVEDWKYTNLRPLTEIAFHEPLIDVGDRIGAREQRLIMQLPQLAAPRLVFVDGRFRAGLSSIPDRATFGLFANDAKFGAPARSSGQPMVALNTMLAEDGACIAVPDDVDAGLVVLASLGGDLQDQPVAFHPRHRIQLGRGARLTVLEVSIGTGIYLHNPVFEVGIAQGATLTHARLQNESESAFHLSTLYVDVAEAATYDSFLLSIGSRLARTEVHARLGGVGGTVHLNGAQLLAGKQHADFTTVVSHDAPACASRQTVKNVLTDHSRAVFQGKIEVARVAQKTDGYQMNQALLLSPHAEIDSKPQLEIFADDVKCSHGATIGELDTEQLFYLRSRGIPEIEARALLVHAFLSEALDPIADDGIRMVLQDAVEAWWTRRSA